MKRYFIIALSAFALASCSFLEEINPTGVTKVLDNEAILESNANGLYANPLMFSCSFLENYGAASGLWIFGQPGTPVKTSSDYTSCHRFTVYSTHQYNKENFNYFYLSAGRANMLIDNLKRSPVSEDYKRELVAEARFVRAVSYFWIVRVFGDAPLRIDAPTSDNASYCPRAPYYEIYAQIIEDLKFAEENMRTPERMEQIAPTQCRPNKFAATAYLSSVYVTIGSLLSHPDDNFWNTDKPERLPNFEACGIKNAKDAYTKALECAERLIPESETHDPQCRYALVDKYSDLFQYTDDFSRSGYNSYKNPEQIFVYSMTRAASTTITYSRNTLPKCCPGTAAATNTTAGNWGRTRPTRFIHQKWARTYPGKYGTGDFKTIVQECADPRMEAALYCKPFQNGVGETVTMYPYSTAGNQASFAPYLKKYWCTDYTGTTSNASVHYMRLPEVYFNAAEAAAYLEREDLARKYIECIHARARRSVPDGQPAASQPKWSDEKTFASPEELITAIFWERQFELLGENQEYMDTHRFGATWLSENIAKPLNDFLMEPANSKLFGQFYDGTAAFRVYEENPAELRKSLLSPIPLDEIDTNAAIENNSNDFWWGM